GGVGGGGGGGAGVGGGGRWGGAVLDAARAFDRAGGVEPGGERGRRSAAPFRLVEQACARQELTARLSQFAVAPSASRARGVLRSREGSSAMKSGWVDSEAQAAIDRYAR